MQSLWFMQVSLLNPFFCLNVSVNKKLCSCWLWQLKNLEVSKRLFTHWIFVLLIIRHFLPFSRCSASYACELYYAAYPMRVSWLFSNSLGTVESEGLSTTRFRSRWHWRVYYSSVADGGSNDNRLRLALEINETRRVRLIWDCWRNNILPPLPLALMVAWLVLRWRRFANWETFTFRNSCNVWGRIQMKNDRVFVLDESLAIWRLAFGNRLLIMYLICLLLMAEEFLVEWAAWTFLDPLTEVESNISLQYRFT